MLPEIEAVAPLWISIAPPPGAYVSVGSPSVEFPENIEPVTVIAPPFCWITPPKYALFAENVPPLIVLLENISAIAPPAAPLPFALLPEKKLSCAESVPP